VVCKTIVIDDILAKQLTTEGKSQHPTRVSLAAIERGEPLWL
jgi:hypothetical protein